MAAQRSEELKTLQEILKWIRFQAKPGLRELVVRVLDTPTKMVVYELSDGASSTREIAAKAHISFQTVAHYWENWSKVGIVEEAEEYQGRSRHICSLQELGLDVPAPALPAQQPSKEQSVKEEPSKEAETKATTTETKAGT